MSLPEPPPSRDEFFPEAEPPRPQKGGILLPLILACVLIGFGAGWVAAPEGTVDPLAVAHARATAGCIPTQFSLATDATPESARRSADAQIQGARAAGFTNAGYLVSVVKGRTVVTLYAEDCRGGA